MDTQDATALELRFRGHDDGCEPDVAAFGRRSADAPLHDAPDRIAMLPGTQPLVPRAPLVVFFQHAVFPIPAPCSALAVLPDLAGWSVQSTVFGYLACVSHERTPRARASWVIAACLPLTLVGGQVEAAPAEAPAKVQRPKSSPKARTETAVPAPSEPATTEPSEPAPGEPTPSETTGEPTTAEPAPSDPFEGEPGTMDGTPTPPPSPRADPLDPALVAAAWQGVIGFDVELELKGGRRLRGKVSAVQAETFTMIQHGNGAVLVLPKSGVVSLRVHQPAAIPTRNGGGLLGGGIAMTTVGTPLFLTGLAFLGICPSCTYIHLPMILIGGAVIGGGIPMIVRGARLRREYRKALQEHALAPVVIRTPHGWSGGLRLRF